MQATKDDTINKEQESSIIGQAIEVPLLAMRKLVKGSLFYCMQYFWECYSQDEFVPNWHIKELSKELEIVARRVGDWEKKLYDLLINVPPGTTKTALVSIFFPVWCWINWYWMRFITSSHSSPLSLESAEYSRDIIRHHRFQEMFPEIDIKQDKDLKSNFRIVKKEFRGVGLPPVITQGGGRISTSVGAKVTGFHAHIIIGDDLIDPEIALSDTRLSTANRHLTQTLSQRKVNRAITPTIMIAQRLAEDDPPGHMLKKFKNVKHICLPGEIKDYGKYLKPKEYAKFYIDNLLDPKRLPWASLNEAEEHLGQYGYAGQIGQNPIPAGGGMFKTDRLVHVESVSQAGGIKKIVRYWDKAGTPDPKNTKQGQGPAYTAGVKMALLNDGRFLIMDVVRGRWASNDREDKIKATANGDSKKCKIGVEQEPGSGGKESAEATVRNLAGFIVKTNRPTGDKVLRADPLSVQVNKYNVLLLKGEWNDKYIDEMRNFPLGKFKDQIDASSGAFAMLTGRLTKKARSLRK